MVGEHVIKRWWKTVVITVLISGAIMGGLFFVESEFSRGAEKGENRMAENTLVVLGLTTFIAAAVGAAIGGWIAKYAAVRGAERGIELEWYHERYKKLMEFGIDLIKLNDHLCFFHDVSLHAPEKWKNQKVKPEIISSYCEKVFFNAPSIMVGDNENKETIEIIRKVRDDFDIDCIQNFIPEYEMKISKCREIFQKHLFLKDRDDQRRISRFGKIIDEVDKEQKRCLEKLSL